MNGFFMGNKWRRPIHIVFSVNKSDNEIYSITVYEPVRQLQGVKSGHFQQEPIKNRKDFIIKEELI